MSARPRGCRLPAMTTTALRIGNRAALLALLVVVLFVLATLALPGVDVRGAIAELDLGGLPSWLSF